MHLANPIKSIRPEPNNQTATGTADVLTILRSYRSEYCVPTNKSHSAPMLPAATNCPVKPVTSFPVKSHHSDVLSFASLSNINYDLVTVIMVNLPLTFCKSYTPCLNEIKTDDEA